MGTRSLPASVSRTSFTLAPGSKRFGSIPFVPQTKGCRGMTHPMLQCAIYALKMLSNMGLRSYGISALVTDDTIRLRYFDRSIIIASPALNFLEDSSRFIAMLKAVTDLLLQQWGFVKLLDPAPLLINPRNAIYSMAWSCSRITGLMSS